MTIDWDNSEDYKRFLSQLNLEALQSEFAQLFMDTFGCHTVGYSIWDEDLEEFGSAWVKGEQVKLMGDLIEDLSESFDNSSSSFTNLETDEEFSELGKTQKIQLENCAYILLSGAEQLKIEEIEEFFEKVPIRIMLVNAWTHTELVKENERLRNSYDELEEQTSTLEDETRKLINDLTLRDSLRTKHVERERMGYEISHLIKDHLEVQKLLETAVEKIGTTLSLSRCHFIRKMQSEEFEIFDYNTEDVPYIKDEFLEGDGLEFTRACLSEKLPQTIDEESVKQDNAFNSKFLEKLGMRSGLVQPVVIHEAIIGSLILEDCKFNREWSIDDMAFFEFLADQLSVAIERAELSEEVKRQAVTDGLTGVANRRSFNQALSSEFERAKRYSQDLSLLVVDLDYLKKINDTYGHTTGDEAIKSIGQVLASSSRANDITARYGGEEFCVLLPNTDLEMAEQLGERLRRTINETEIDGPGNISASIGVASYPIHADTSDMLFLRADEALYQAKQEGRNCIRVSSMAPDGSDIDNQKGDAKQSLVEEQLN